MKFVKFTAVALLSTLLMMGCNGEKISFGNGENNSTSNTGLLSITELSIDCRIDESAGGEEGGLVPEYKNTSATRSAIDTSNFECSIINEKNEVVKSFLFGERPTEAIELETGDYILKIQSGEVPGAAWEHPVYGTEEPFKIIRNETTPLSQIVCSLMQIKISITYATDLLDRLGNKTLATVSVDGNGEAEFLEYSLTESRAGFFRAPYANNIVRVAINGTYAADGDKAKGKVVNMSSTIKDVKAGQHRKIHFFLEHAADGNVDVGVVVRDWITDEIIPCSIDDLVSEDEWVENGGNQGGGDDNTPTTPAEDPNIVWDGHDISQREAITAGLEVDLLVSASNGIKEFYVKIESASLTPAELAGVGLCDVLNLCYPKKSYDSNNPGVFIDVEDPLRGLGFAVADEVVNKTFVKLSITQFMGVLQAVSGTDLKNHDFVLTVVDNKGNTCEKTLMLQTGK